jgi:hypothetical protein
MRKEGQGDMGDREAEEEEEGRELRGREKGKR